MKPKNILVVDDDSEITMIIEEILKQKDYKVTVAHDGLNAIEESKKEQVDLILMDVRLPIFSGFWFCDAFKRKPETKNVPIVIVSSLSGPEDVQKAFRVGACAYLKKPFLSDELLTVVQKALKEAA